jgi:aldehyde dehydrogenase (NAD+)
MVQRTVAGRRGWDVSAETGGELWREERMLIGGALVEAADGATYENVDPATERVLGVAADAGPRDMAAAIAAARAAFDGTSWSTDVALRVRCLRQLH